MAICQFTPNNLDWVKPIIPSLKEFKEEIEKANEHVKISKLSFFKCACFKPNDLTTLFNQGCSEVLFSHIACKEKTGKTTSTVMAIGIINDKDPQLDKSETIFISTDNVLPAMNKKLDTNNFFIIEPGRAKWYIPAVEGNNIAELLKGFSPDKVLQSSELSFIGMKFKTAYIQEKIKDWNPTKIAVIPISLETVTKSDSNFEIHYPHCISYILAMVDNNNEIIEYKPSNKVLHITGLGWPPSWRF